VSHHEIEELLGAYALDAVDADEARQVEDHLRECPRCRAEVAAHREVASLLISSSTHPVPEGVWDRITAELGDTPPPVPIEVAFGRRPATPTTERPRPRGVLVGLAAAAAVALIAALGAVLVNQGDDGDPADHQLAALLAQPDTELVDLQTEDGEPGARALIGPDGEGVLVATDLPDLGTGQTYQLWGLPEGGDEMVSLGVLGAEPERASFHVEGEISALAISREPGGGSTAPTTDPLVLGEVA
jgi:anti-sigma-K factor RskA